MRLDLKMIPLVLMLILTPALTRAALLQVTYSADRAASGPGFCTDYIYECPDSVALTMTVDTSTYQGLRYNVREDTRVQSYGFHGAKVTEILLVADGRVLLDDPTGMTFGGGGENASSGDYLCFCYYRFSDASGSANGGGSVLSLPPRWPLVGELGEDPLAVLLLAKGQGGRDVGGWSFTGEWGALRDLDGLMVTSAVPIPAAVWLFGTALGVLGLLRRRLVQGVSALATGTGQWTN